MVAYCDVEEDLDMEILRISRYSELPSTMQKQQQRICS